jgi:hypothetical protein
MTLHYAWTSALLGLGVAATILFLVRRNHLHTRYALWWLGAAFAVGLAGLFPNLVDRVADRFGVTYPPTLVLVLAIALLAIKLLLMDIERSRSAVRLQRLTQRLAILESRLPPAGAPPAAPQTAPPEYPAAPDD